MNNFYGNWVDLIIILFSLTYLLTSWGRGFLAEFFELAGFLFSLIGSLLLFGLIAPIYLTYFNIPISFSNALGFFTAWFLIELIYFLIIRKALQFLPQKFVQSKLNQFSVFIPAFVSSLLLASFIFTLIIALPSPPILKKSISDSKIGSFLIKITSKLDNPLERAFGGAVQDSLNFLTVKPSSSDVIKLNVPQLELTVDLESEAKMLDLVNLERQKVGAKPLNYDGDLQKAARLHSEDMFRRSYFSHFSPEGKDVGDRLAEANIAYLVAGENLAYAPNVSIAHQGLMNSEGHRRNILDSSFAKVGIGVVDGGAYGKMFTQVFKD